MSEGAPSTRLLSLITYVGLSVGILANIGGVLGIFGVAGSLRLGYVISGIGLAILLATFCIRYVLSLRSDRNALRERFAAISESAIEMSKILTTDSTKAYLKDSAPKEIHVLGSGTETYFLILSQLFKEGVIQGGATIHIGFRVGVNPNRYSKLREYDSKWSLLARRYNLRLQYYAYQDFFFLIRGIVFDKKIGFVGFYHRINDFTEGVDEPIIVAKGDNSVSLYLIKNFLKIFDCLDRRDTISSALDNELAKNEVLPKQ
jgi:hypothetical protein